MKKIIILFLISLTLMTFFYLKKDILLNIFGSQDRKSRLELDRKSCLELLEPYYEKIDELDFEKSTQYDIFVENAGDEISDDILPNGTILINLLYYDEKFDEIEMCRIIKLWDLKEIPELDFKEFLGCKENQCKEKRCEKEYGDVLILYGYEKKDEWYELKYIVKEPKDTKEITAYMEEGKLVVIEDTLESGYIIKFYIIYSGENLEPFMKEILELLC